MIKMFGELKALYIEEIRQEIYDIDQRILFIVNHNSGNLIIEDRDDEEVYAKMDELKIERKYYDIIKARDFSMKKVEELKEHKKELFVKLKKIED